MWKEAPAITTASALAVRGCQDGHHWSVSACQTKRAWPTIRLSRRSLPTRPKCPIHLTTNTTQRMSVYLSRSMRGFIKRRPAERPAKLRELISMPQTTPPRPRKVLQARLRTQMRLTNAALPPHRRALLLSRALLIFWSEHFLSNPLRRSPASAVPHTATSFPAS